jgi:hypothetical protein
MSKYRAFKIDIYKYTEKNLRSVWIHQTGDIGIAGCINESSIFLKSSLLFPEIGKKSTTIDDLNASLEFQEIDLSYPPQHRFPVLRCRYQKMGFSDVDHAYCIISPWWCSW